MTNRTLRPHSPAGQKLARRSATALTAPSKKHELLLVTNHASFSGDSSHFAVLSVFVRDQADPLETPHFHEH